MMSLDDLRDVVHGELETHAAALKPPDSDEDTRHLPMAVLVAEVVQQVVVPFVVSVASAFASEWFKRRADRKRSEVIRERIARVEAHEPEAIDDAELEQLLEAIGGSDVRPDSASVAELRGNLTDTTVVILRRYHLGPKVSDDVATKIETALLNEVGLGGA